VENTIGSNGSLAPASSFSLVPNSLFCLIPMTVHQETNLYALGVFLLGAFVSVFLKNYNVKF
jgi:hypothetical protein